MPRKSTIRRKEEKLEIVKQVLNGAPERKNICNTKLSCLNGNWSRKKRRCSA